MILPDIQNCSKSDQITSANSYWCFWCHGALWQPLWLKNSHSMAIFCHFLTFLVTFSAAVIPFMHKTCAERTKTFLIHRTIDEYTFFAISRHLYRVPGVQNGPFGTKNGLTWQACQSPDVVQKGPKWSQMVNITCFWPFGTIWTDLHHFGPFKTKINFSPQKHKVLLGQSSLEQKNQV